jgi:hypothetical protein
MALTEEQERRHHEIAAELRIRLGLPEWSNIRGDDVIAPGRGARRRLARAVNDLLAERREIDDESGSSG